MQNIEKLEPLTIEQVNARIPFVRRVVADLIDHWEQREDVRTQLGRFRRELPGSGSGELTETIRRLEEEDQRLTTVLQEFEAEINQVGGLVKNPAGGLVDFISRHDGELIFLSWMPEDSEIAYWHGIDEDCNERQRLPGHGEADSGDAEDAGQV